MMNDSAVNQCAAATTFRRDIRVCPRNSLVSTQLRVNGAPVRPASGWPIR